MGLREANLSPPAPVWPMPSARPPGSTSSMKSCVSARWHRLPRKTSRSWRKQRLKPPSPTPHAMRRKPNGRPGIVRRASATTSCLRFAQKVLEGPAAGGEHQFVAARLATLESLAIAVQPRRQQEESGVADPEDRAGVCVRRHGDELGKPVGHRHPTPACDACSNVVLYRSFAAVQP